MGTQKSCGALIFKKLGVSEPLSTDSNSTDAKAHGLSPPSLFVSLICGFLSHMLFLLMPDMNYQIETIEYSQYYFISQSAF